MELKTGRLTLLIDPNKKAAFERLCAKQGRSASQVVRQLIRDHLAHHGLVYEASGVDDDIADPAAPAAAPSPTARAQSGTRAGPHPGTRRSKG